MLNIRNEKRTYSVTKDHNTNSMNSSVHKLLKLEPKVDTPIKMSQLVLKFSLVNSILSERKINKNTYINPVYLSQKNRNFVPKIPTEKFRRGFGVERDLETTKRMIAFDEEVQNRCNVFYHFKLDFHPL